MRIPLAAPDITEADIEAVTGVLRTPWLSMGPKLAEFEDAVARSVGVPHAVAVNSGTSALHLCVRALGIADGDEVIVPSFAFIAVANAVRYERAVPVFVDVEPVTLTMDAGRIEEAITPRTRAIVVVHTFGCPADMSPIMRIARRRGLAVIEDACEALGAEYQGRPAGSLGDVGVFAFYPNKQVTTGEGGMVVARDPVIAATVRRLRNQGRDDAAGWYQHVELGFSYRLPEMNCALGVEQLKRMDAVLRRRDEIAAGYHRRLSGRPGLAVPPQEVPRRRISWFAYVVRLGQEYSQAGRDRVVREMASRGIQCGRYFAPIHRQPIYRGMSEGASAMPVTEAHAPRCLALPFFNRIRDDEMGEVCRALGESMALARAPGPAPTAQER